MIRLKIALVAALFLIGYMFCLWLLIPAPAKSAERSAMDQIDMKAMGCSALTEKWDGTVTAYKWRKGKYVVMWERKKI